LLVQWANLLPPPPSPPYPKQQGKEKAVHVSIAMGNQLCEQHIIYQRELAQKKSTSFN